MFFLNMNLYKELIKESEKAIRTHTSTIYNTLGQVYYTRIYLSVIYIIDLFNI